MLQGHSTESAPDIPYADKCLLFYCSHLLYRMEGRTLTISYAEPKYSEEQAATPLKSRAVYVGNLPPGASEDRVKELFTQYGEVSSQHSELLIHADRTVSQHVEHT